MMLQINAGLLKQVARVVCRVMAVSNTRIDVNTYCFVKVTVELIRTLVSPVDLAYYT